jgi:hypothetical protein
MKWASMDVVMLMIILLFYVAVPGLGAYVASDEKLLNDTDWSRYSWLIAGDITIVNTEDNLLYKTLV